MKAINDILNTIEINCQSSIRIEDELVIYFDPYDIKESRHDANYIFITHPHWDHFNIEAIDKVNGTQVSISYNKNDLASANTTNTTQWDYEGFLGFNQVGSELTNPLNIQLEKGIWKIDRDEDYQKIKGTVILYDTDDRAANDFN